jgi:glucose-6-phosphate 1-epimerase
MGDRELGALRERFGGVAGVRIGRGAGGLARLELDSGLASADVYLHGAQVTRFVPRGARDVLWLSPRAAFGPGKAIRGGVPVCFPWFGVSADPSLPQHGFARLMDWDLVSLRSEGGLVRAVLALAASGATRALWPRDFRAELAVEVSDGLSVSLRVVNAGREALEFQDALHTYLAVGDVRRVALAGLGGAAYLDGTRGEAPDVEPAGEIAFPGPGEFCRNYLDSDAGCVVRDPVLGREVAVGKSGSRSTVVWNPGPERAARIADMEPEGWREFLCVESGNVRRNALALAPGEEHVTTQTIAAAPH